jgi:urate oxidase
MSIKKYTNFENINNKTDNVGQFLEDKDLFIVSKNEIQASEFGNTPYDVMEISVYDINNNLLPQSTGNNVAYIKTDDIKNYMYQITNKQGLKELAIDIEKLLKYLGFTNDDDIFVRLPDYKVDKITAVLSKYFEFTKTDVTDKVISGEIAKIYPEVKEVTPKLFTDFRLDNTSVDDILDKIIESGIDSLDKIDKTILKKSHSK